MLTWDVSFRIKEASPLSTMWILKMEKKNQTLPFLAGSFRCWESKIWAKEIRSLNSKNTYDGCDWRNQHVLPFFNYICKPSIEIHLLEQDLVQWALYLKAKHIQNAKPMF